MCDYLTLADFFIVGLGLDIAGATLLARGLIASPLDLTRLSGSFYGSNMYLAVGMARDRLDAISGLIALGIGFLLQAVGYMASLATDQTPNTGVPLVVTGMALLVGAVAAALALGALHRRLRLIATLVEMSRYTIDGSRAEFPRAALLPRYLEAAGLPRRRSDDDLGFVRRVAGVQDLIVDVGGERSRRWTDKPFPDE